MDPIEEFFAAIDKGDLSGMQSLLRRDPSLVNAKAKHDYTPLHRAAEKDQPEAAGALLGAGAELEAKVSWGMTPLEWAANIGSRARGRSLIDPWLALDALGCRRTGNDRRYPFVLA